MYESRSVRRTTAISGEGADDEREEECVMIFIKTCTLVQIYTIYITFFIMYNIIYMYSTKVQQCSSVLYS